MPDNWGFFVNEELVYDGYARWAATGFERMPTLEEVLDGQNEWEQSVILFGRLVQFKKGWKKRNGLGGADLSGNNST